MTVYVSISGEPTIEFEFTDPVLQQMQQTKGKFTCVVLPEGNEYRIRVYEGDYRIQDFTVPKEKIKPKEIEPPGSKYEFNQTFAFDMNAPRTKLSGLASTAKLLPVDYLKNWLRYFIDMEKYEEAAIIKKELEERK